MAPAKGCVCGDHCLQEAWAMSAHALRALSVCNPREKKMHTIISEERDRNSTVLKETAGV